MFLQHLSTLTFYENGTKIMICKCKEFLTSRHFLICEKSSESKRSLDWIWRHFSSDDAYTNISIVFCPASALGRTSYIMPQRGTKRNPWVFILFSQNERKIALIWQLWVCSNVDNIFVGYDVSWRQMMQFDPQSSSDPPCRICYLLKKTRGKNGK